MDEGDTLLEQQQPFVYDSNHVVNGPLLDSIDNTSGGAIGEMRGPFVGSNGERVINSGMMIQNDEIEGDSPRGEEHSAFVNSFTSHLLRLGFSMQASSLLFMLVFYSAFGGSGLFIFDLYAAPENVKISSAFHLVISILTAIYLLGIFYVAIFQVFVADNSKLCRGFRTGSKMLSAAVTLDAVCTSLRLVQYLYAYFYMNMRWWSRYQQSKFDWLLFNSGNVLNAFALCMYGTALFYMEAYHHEGTAEEYGWINLFLFFLAAISELAMVFTGYGAFYTLFMMAASISACIWAYSFEPLLEKWTPELHSRDINADILPEEGTEMMDSVGVSGGLRGDVTGEGNEFCDVSTAVRDPTDATKTYTRSHEVPSIFQNNDLPTSYDFSEMQKQISQGIQMGVVNAPC